MTSPARAQYWDDNGGYYYTGDIGETVAAALERAQAVQLQLESLLAALPAGLPVVLPDEVRRGSRNEGTRRKYTTKEIALQHRSLFCTSMLHFHFFCCSHERQGLEYLSELTC